MRSIAEMKFRAGQEAANVRLLLLPPQFAGVVPLQLSLPDTQAVAAVLRGSAYKESVQVTAQNILAHRFPLLGATVETGPEIRWRRDYQHGRESGLEYFRRIPYLDFSAVGDHKFIWELNRHQHLVLLGQAYALTGAKEYPREIFAQIESWLEQNPFQRGINWASALEVAFRALSWIWIYHFTAEAMPEDFRRCFLTALYRHGRHLAENLSVYFSPNTHLLGEAVALHALGVLFPAFPESERWRARGAHIVEAQIAFQVRADGSHFEQSTYYHVYALDFFLFYYLIAGRPKHMEPVLARMTDYLDWLLGPARRIAFSGDDDGGRLFHPFGERDRFGRATLTTCGILLANDRWIGSRETVAEQAAWWLGAEHLAAARLEQAPPIGGRRFEESGTVFLQSGDLFVQFDAGPLGWGGAGHSHADTLSVLVWFRGEPVFIDPGTYTYVADPEARNWFRGTAAHNTVSIDGQDQAQAAGPFRWNSKPEVELSAWRSDASGGMAQAACRYNGFTHRRSILLESGRLLVLDEVDGRAGEHDSRQIWQLGLAASKVHLSFSSPAIEEESQLSSAYGAKAAGRLLAARVRGPLPAAIAMLLTVEVKQEIDVEEARAILEETRKLADKT
jgi:uncharacterized heparinase superfamily protein